MIGQIVRRGPRTWLVRIPMGRRATGTRAYHNRTIQGTKRDAQRYLTQTLRELDTGTFVEASPKILAAWLNEWLQNTVRTRLRSKTFSDYQSLSSRYLVPEIGHRKLSQLGPAEIQKLYTDMQDRGLSPRTVRYAHSVLHGALEQAVKWNLIARNPCKMVNLPRLERKEMHSLTAEQVTRFLQAARGTRFEVLWTLLVTTGLRPGEALGLKFEDLDLETGRLRVQRALVWQGDGNWQLLEPKTAKARRVISLPSTTIRALRSQRVRQAEDQLSAGEDWMDMDLVFTTRLGGPLEYRVLVRRFFKPLISLASLPAIRPYDLRHTCATLLLGMGANVKVVSERLGHASAALTLDVYSHVLPDMQQQAAEGLENLLFSAAQ